MSAPHAIFESDQFASIFALVAAGTGVSLIPAMAAASAEGCRVVRFTRKVSGASATRTLAATLDRPLKRRSSTGSEACSSRCDDAAAPNHCSGLFLQAASGTYRAALLGENVRFSDLSQSDFKKVTNCCLSVSVRFRNWRSICLASPR